MDSYLSFDGRIEPLPWGGKVFTIIPVPDPVAEALRQAGARRVEGEINDHPVNLALSRAPVTEATFLWAGKTLMTAIGAEPGDLLEVRLRPVADEVVETPEDVASAIRAAGATERWENLGPGKRRAALYQVATAKRSDTRARRIARLVADL